ncbi:MAG: AraC family transcriptional regulator, partial [Gammaproteobacteria bacterium]|nr:AraC family transcriptional regulator [Gammaproteobacteria bacterium]
LNAPTTRQAMESFCQFQQIYGEGMQIQTRSENGCIEIMFTPHPVLETHCGHGAFLSHMSGLISTVNWLLNRDVVPTKVFIGQQKPQNNTLNNSHLEALSKEKSNEQSKEKLKEKLKEQLKELTNVFGPNIKFSAGRYAIVYDNNCFDGNVITNNPELFSLFEHRAENVINQLGRNTEFKTAVASCLLKSLDGGKPSLENIASQLHKSTRTVQRLLKLEGTSFQNILDEVRQKSATYYLQSSSLNIDEITYLLGFSDASAFRKSFKKWTQCTPEKFRKKAP